MPFAFFLARKSKLFTKFQKKSAQDNSTNRAYTAKLTGGERLEEIAGGLVEPALQSIYNGKTADKDWLKRLEKMGATAVTIGDNIIFRPDATVTEVLEEVYHFEQNKKKMNYQWEHKVMRLLMK